MGHINPRFRSRGFFPQWKPWLSSLIVASACVLFFTAILAVTPLGRQVVSTFRFLLGWQYITRQQQQFIQAVDTAFQAARLSVEVHRRGIAIPQRRGQERWQHEIYTIRVPRSASIDRYETVLRDTTHRRHHTILRRQRRLSAADVNVTITVGIADVPANTFVLTQPRGLTSVPSSRAQVAIVIDDLGWDLEAAHAMLTLGAPLSFAILPNTPYHMNIAQEARRRGYDVLLHLPMEPYRYPEVDPGHPVLLSTMRPNQLVAQIGIALDALPDAVGVNNHMGSRLTENRSVMQTVMQQMKHHKLFFLDSRTTKHSLAYQVAREMGVPTAQRQVFLDHEADLIKIREQLHHLAMLAYVHGSAIGIGHPYPQTVHALKEALREFRQDGIEIVPVSHLVK